MPPQRVWFLHRFGLETAIDFAHFGHESSIVFEGTTGMYEAIKVEAFIKTGFIWIVSSRKLKVLSLVLHSCLVKRVLTDSINELVIAVIASFLYPCMSNVGNEW